MVHGWGIENGGHLFWINFHATFVEELGSVSGFEKIHGASPVEEVVADRRHVSDVNIAKIQEWIDGRKVRKKEDVGSFGMFSNQPFDFGANFRSVFG